MALPTCPTCHKLFDPEASRALPFCRDRCRSIDLNRWLSEEIALPYHDVNADELPDGLPDQDDDGPVDPDDRFSNN